MQTQLTKLIRDTAAGAEAESILRKCVHCGFCLANCPTYRLLGDELDGPRGRIYLMKSVLEGAQPTAATQLHLDRCLTCLACETTCPSGVRYGRLLDITRPMVETRVGRTPVSALTRKALLAVLPHRGRFAIALGLARALRPLLPRRLRSKLHPAGPKPASWPTARHARRMIILEGCVQPALEPGIDAAAARLLDAVGISPLRAGGSTCCGAIAHHLSADDAARAQARINIDAWWPLLAAGAEAIVVTASGCVPTVRSYDALLREDPAYAERAARIVASVRDISEVLAAEERALLPALAAAEPVRPVAFHSPCSLQHALGVRGVVERLLRAAGYEPTPVPDSHICCGSAGTYSILQPELAGRLLADKVRALESGNPQSIATANIGCLGHIRGGTALPVRHWVELLAERIRLP